jgi:hypothetical protein
MPLSDIARLGVRVKCGYPLWQVLVLWSGFFCCEMLNSNLVGDLRIIDNANDNNVHMCSGVGKRAT